MATLEDFRAWYDRDLGRYAPWKTSVQITGTGDVPEGTLPAHREIQIRIFTDKNRYGISVQEPSLRRVYEVPKDWPVGQPLRGPVFGDGVPFTTQMDDGYLGCIASSRRWRAGEDWHRGSDLPDGPFTEETWRRVLAAIVSYELVDVVKESRPDYVGAPPRGVPDDGHPVTVPAGAETMVVKVVGEGGGDKDGWKLP